MDDIFSALLPADYEFLIGVIEAPISFTDTGTLRTLQAAVEQEDTATNRTALNRALEREVRYLGSSDLAYLYRTVTSQDPGVSFRTIIRDVAKVLKVDPGTLGTDREMLEHVVQTYATKQFAHLPPEEQQQLLESLGVDRERATAFLKRSAGVFALPTLIQAFGTIVVNGLIKTVIFGAIGKIIGTQLAMKLFQFLMSRLPWWVSWIGPAAWTLSIGWTALDLQGPALRKTVPIVLYLGLCSLREEEGEEATGE